MAHPEQRHWCAVVKNRYPAYFRSTRVIDFGALDVNGNNRGLFEDCEYLGLDIGPGPNVDLVSLAHEYAGASASFDVVVSTEMLEHDPHFALSLGNMVRVLRPGGLLLFTCAAPGRREHGTRGSSPGDSPLTSGRDDWADYYRNLSERDIRSVLDVDAIFAAHEFQTDNSVYDLRFWGIKAN